MLVNIYNARAKHIQNLTNEKIVEILVDLIKPIKYISYDKKIEIAKMTIKQEKTQEFPTPFYYRRFIINLISAYTNIEMDIEGFDILSENKMIDIILSLFEQDYKVCNTIFQMCLDDFERR